MEFIKEVGSSNTNEKLCDRMKKYETIIDNIITIKPHESFIVRLDGRSFSKFTKKFFKPFDIIFIKAMGLTTLDLIAKFDAQTGYTHSDEITLIFNSKSSESEYNEYLEKQLNNLSIKSDMITTHMFNGRIQKILSLISSYCSVKFNYHLEKLIKPFEQSYDAEFIKLIQLHEQMFDARILIFEETNKYEILNHQIWRSIHDCSRNAIQTYAYTYFGSRKIMNKNTCKMIQMMKDEKKLDWDDENQVPLFIKYGLYCKKIIINKVIGENVVSRSEYVFKQYKIDFSQENLDILLAKYWNDFDSWNGKIILDELFVQTVNSQVNEVSVQPENLQV